MMANCEICGYEYCVCDYLDEIKELENEISEIKKIMQEKLEANGESEKDGGMLCINVSSAKRSEPVPLVPRVYIDADGNVKPLGRSTSQINEVIPSRVNQNYVIGTCKNCGVGGHHIGTIDKICWNCYDELKEEKNND